MTGFFICGRMETINPTIYKVHNMVAASKGNQFWKLRSKHGRGKLFESADLLWDAACEYFQWCEDNPLKKEIVYQGEVSAKKESLMRAMTIKGLCFRLNANTDYLTAFDSKLDLNSEEGRDFSRVIKDIRAVIYSQKFEGASAGLLNANIIARDLGLTDKQEIKQVTDMTDEELDKKIKELMTSSNDS